MPQHSDLRVLIADDHFLIRQFVKRALADIGIVQVEMVNDGQEAVDAIGKSLSEGALYDMVFLDWNMPGLSGIEALSYVRSKPQYQNAAVVMFTAESEKTNIMKAIKLGATTYILKPISPSDLNKKIREILDWLGSRKVAKI